MMEPSDDFADAATIANGDDAATTVVVVDTSQSIAMQASRSKYEVTQQQQRALPSRLADSGDSDSDEFHDSESDAGASNFVVVKKSIFKEPKRSSGGLMNRLKDATGLRSPARNKYVLTAAENSSDGASVVVPQTIPRRQRIDLEAAEPPITIATHAIDDDANERDNSSQRAAAAVSLTSLQDDGDDGSAITVAIRATGVEPLAAQSSDAPMMIAESDDYGSAPQVVIHSGESDSDATAFATLNPVIGASAARRFRSTVSLASASSIHTTSTGNIREAAPCLHAIPALTDADASATSDATFALIVHALGASGLVKVEKFGTQSTFLEMRLCDNSDDTAAITTSSCELPTPAPGTSVMRTALHRKGGSDAQWHQQFTSPLRAKHTQWLHLAVRTNGRAIIGVAHVALAAVPTDGQLYDQHYTLYRRARPAVTGSARPTSDDDCDGVEAGRVHLQLQIVDAASFASSISPHATSAIEPTVPAVLRNGALFFKVPFHSSGLGSAAAVRRQWVAVSSTDGLEITWCDPTARPDDSSRVRRLRLALVTDVREGHATDAFTRYNQRSRNGTTSAVAHERALCFSLVTNSRTLDLVAASKDEARVWVTALRSLLSLTSSPSDSSDSARVIADYRLAALSPRSGGPSSSSESFAPFASSKSQQLETWRTTVFDLARQSRIDDLSACLTAGCPIDLLEPGDGDTILMIACRRGDVALVALCLRWRAKNDPHPEFGDTALQAAVNAAHTQCVALLLATAAASDMDAEIVNHIDANSDAPLHVAARNGDLACLELLLHHGADVCVVDASGRTPLHCAVAHSRCDCVAYLLDVGGDAVLNAGDAVGDTALHYAARSGDVAAVKVLLESAANVFAANAQNETPYDTALQAKQQSSARLIAQYYLTNAKETQAVPVAASTSSYDNDDGHHSAPYNEAESTLRLRQQHQVLDEPSSNEDDDSRSERSDSDTDATYVLRPRGFDEPRRRAPQYMFEQQRRAGRAFAGEYDGDDDGRYDEYAHYGAHRSFSVSSLPAASRAALSASDQVREALLRHQTLRALPVHRSATRDSYAHSHQLHRYAAAPVRSIDIARIDPDRNHACYYSAREPTSSYDMLLARGASTERIDRSDQRAMGFGSHGRAADDMQYVAGRSYSDAELHRHAMDQNGVLNSSRYDIVNRRSDSVDMAIGSVPAVHAMQTAWSSSANVHRREASAPAPVVHQPAPAPTPPAAHPLYDTFYTQDGYPYYVHRVTGVSQWELPTAPPPPTSPPSTLLTPALAPDSLIRMRLAEARNQHSSTSVSESSTLVRHEPATMYDDSLGAVNAVQPQPLSPIATVEADADVAALATESYSSSPPAASESTPTTAALPTTKSSPSKIQARAGFKLSIDIASPARVDETRPVFVPSPRSRSPSKLTTKTSASSPANSALLESPSYDATGSFQKSRPSSPRSKSKTVQLLERKRANNLAIALASFKVHDTAQYEHVVRAIATMNDKSVSAELLACLQRFFPTADEQQQLTAFRGRVTQLGKAEQFFYLLLHVPRVHERVDMLLYKLEFVRSHRSLLATIQVVKRACRDLLENYSFLDALEEFYSKHTPKRLSVLEAHQRAFASAFLPHVDEKFRSFRSDLDHARSVELMDVQLQLNRLVGGIQAIQTFVDTHAAVAAAAADERDLAACGALQLFLAETRGTIAEIEREHESMGAYEEKLLDAFGESRASCQLASIFECVANMLRE